MKTKKSKIKSLLARILAFLGIICVVLSCFLVPASADGVSTSNVVFDQLLGGGFIRGTSGFLYTFNSVNPNLGSGASWADYFRTTSSNSSSNVGFTSFLYTAEPGNLMHRMVFTNDVGRNVFREVDITLNDIIYYQFAQDPQFKVPYIAFIEGTNARLFTVSYTVTYERVSYDSNGAVLDRSFVTEEFERDRPTTGQAWVNVPFLPNYGADSTLKNEAHYSSDGEVEYIAGDYVYVQSCRLEFTSYDPLQVDFPTSYRIIAPVEGGVEASPGDYAAYIYRFNREPLQVDFTDWLVTGIGGFLSFEILPGMSFSAILGVIAGIGVVLAFLRIFAGG